MATLAATAVVFFKETATFKIYTISILGD